MLVMSESQMLAEHPPRPSAPVVVEVHTLAKHYAGAQNPAVCDVSFSVHQGECLGLLGPNGAGKSTLIGMLSSLIRPTGGQARICGHDIVTDAQQVQSCIGLIPQDLALYPTLTARENLSYFGRLHGLRGQTLRRLVDEALTVVGLSDRANDIVEKFSGGMKRRVNLAAGLLHRPKVVFLDEPTVGVDPQSRSFIFTQIETLKAQGTTLIYTTHYMEEAERLCDRIAIIDHGRMVALNTPAALIEGMGYGMLIITLPAPAPHYLMQQLRTLPHVSDVQQCDHQLNIKSRAANRALPVIVAALNDQGVAIEGIVLNKPNLEIVFLELTGRQLRD